MKSLLTTPLVLLALLAPLNAGADFDKGLAAYEAEDYATALQEFKKDAEQGDARAQSKLGVMYDNGEGVPQDYKEAVKWYTLAAEQGHTLAQANLGWMYDFGYGVPEDDVQAVKWYTLAAEQGNPYSQSDLGYMYSRGHGVAVDYSKAHLLFKDSLGEIEASSLLSAAFWGRVGIYTAENAFGYGLPLAALLVLLHIFAKRRGWPAYLRFFTFLLCSGFIGLGLIFYLALKGWLFEFFGIALAVYGLIRLFRGRRAKCPHCGFQNSIQRLNFATAGDRNAFYSDDTSKKIALKFECKKCKTDFIKEYKLRELTGKPPV